MVIRHKAEIRLRGQRQTVSYLVDYRFAERAGDRITSKKSNVRETRSRSERDRSRSRIGSLEIP